MPESPDTYDDLLASLLIRSWIIATGRTLRTDVPPQELSVEELIEFWADDCFGELDAIFAGHVDRAGHAGRAGRPGHQARHAKRPRECSDSA
jgi:hypothetical protein